LVGWLVRWDWFKFGYSERWWDRSTSEKHAKNNCFAQGKQTFSFTSWSLTISLEKFDSAHGVVSSVASRGTALVPTTASKRLSNGWSKEAVAWLDDESEAYAFAANAADDATFSATCARKNSDRRTNRASVNQNKYLQIKMLNWEAAYGYIPEQWIFDERQSKPKRTILMICQAAKQYRGTTRANKQNQRRGKVANEPCGHEKKKKNKYLTINSALATITQIKK
jgi:hypothetical protein